MKVEKYLAILAVSLVGFLPACNETPKSSETAELKAALDEALKTIEALKAVDTAEKAESAVVPNDGETVKIDGEKFVAKVTLTPASEKIVSDPKTGQVMRVTMVRDGEKKTVTTVHLGGTRRGIPGGSVLKIEEFHNEKLVRVLENIFDEDGAHTHVVEKSLADGTLESTKTAE